MEYPLCAEQCSGDSAMDTITPLPSRSLHSSKEGKQQTDAPQRYARGREMPQKESELGRGGKRQHVQRPRDTIKAPWGGATPKARGHGRALLRPRFLGK